MSLQPRPTETPSTDSATPGRIVRPQTNRTGWMRWVPGLLTLRQYQSSWLRHDVVAGLVMTTMLVPVGIAYAEASGLPGINGLYATIVPLLAYALFGPSRILVLGPDSALAAVILAVVLPLTSGDSGRAVPLGGMMAIVSGVVCVAAGLSRLGFITELLSKPIRYGYMNGIALTVILSQMPKLFGFSVSADGPVRQLLGIIEKVWDGSTNVTVLAIGGSALVLILVLKRWPRLPGMLIAVAAATIAVAVLDLAARAGVSVLGPLPQGLPAPRIPLAPLDSLVPILTGGLAVALVSFADTSVLSRTYAARLRTPVDPNQEMVGLGLANVAAGLFQGFPISSSSSRTPVAEAAGAKTQLTGVVGALAIALLLLFAPAMLQDLPNTALAAIVIASAIGLIEVADLRSHLSHPTLGILAVDGLFRGGGGLRGHSRHRARDRDCRHRVPLGRLAPAFGRARPRRRRQGVSRHYSLSERPSDPGARPVPLGCAALLRQRRVLPRPRSRRRREFAHPRPMARRRRRACDEHRRHVR